MILKLIDKTEISLTDREAQAVERMVEQGKEFIKIGTQLIKRSQIAQIIQGNISTPVFHEDRALNAPQYNCVNAGTSIQYEIHRRAMKHKNWPKLVRDKAWREKTRLEIRAEDPDRRWCDNHMNQHACLEADGPK